VPYIWAALSTALNIASGIDGSLGLLDRLRRKLTAGRTVIEHHFLDWAQRGADPVTFADTLRRVPWVTEDLAMLLGIAPEEVAALMELYGFALDQDGRWRPSEDEEARLLRLLEEDAMWAFTKSRRDARPPEIAFRDRAQMRLA
jgi:hypothetical protein